MAELIAAIAEAIANLVVAFFELLPAILEGLFYIAEGALLVVCLILSPRYRHKKFKEWQGKPIRKFFELGLSSACLSALMFFGAWLCWPTPKATAQDKPPALTMYFDARQEKGSNTFAIEFQSRQSPHGRRVVFHFPTKGATNSSVR